MVSYKKPVLLNIYVIKAGAQEPAGWILRTSPEEMTLSRSRKAVIKSDSHLPKKDENFLGALLIPSLNNQ